MDFFFNIKKLLLAWTCHSFLQILLCHVLNFESEVILWLFKSEINENEFVKNNPNFNKLILNKLARQKTPRRSFKHSKSFCLELSLNKKRCCQKCNQSKQLERSTRNILPKPTKRSLIEMISSKFFFKKWINLKVWDNNNHEFAVG